jgi:Ca-activated chloride channel family protein
MTGRAIVIVAALLAVAIAAFSSTGGDSDDKGGGGGGTVTSAPKGALVVPFAFSPEKEQLLAPVIKDFNADNVEVDGKRVFIDGEVRSSGEAQALIARGRYKPVLWSPSSSFWGRLLNNAADRNLAPDENPSIVRTPLVIAMWEELAKAYGYPKKTLAYADVARLATDGWKSIGKPQFGTFKYVHTNPDFSTSGLSAVAASYYAAAGKREGLTLADVNGGKVRSRVKEIERSVVHYGDTTLFIADEMRKRGLGYASAVAMEETTLIDFNKKARSGPKLVAIYPRDGTFFSDNPLITLDGDWVSDAQRKGAAAFAKVVAEKVDADVAARYGFRPADPGTKAGGALTSAFGVDATQPSRTLAVPEPKVLARIKEAWRADRKPANVLVVLDNSGSMGEEGKMEQAKDGLRRFIAEAEPQDKLGLWTFSTDIEKRVPIGRVGGGGRARLLQAVGEVFPDGDTSIYDATLEGVRAVEAELDRGAINAVVVLTDGQDTASTRTARAVLDELERQGEKESGEIRVFTIAYGSEPDVDVLASFAGATGGKPFVATTDDIERVYLSIASFF